MRTDELYLTDMLTAADRITSFLSGLNSFHDFFLDEKSQDAILMNLIIIGEAANRISEETILKAPTIPWDKIAGFRHVAVHGYFSLDLNQVWEIAAHQINPLQESVDSLLQLYYPETYKKYVARKAGNEI